MNGKKIPIKDNKILISILLAELIISVVALVFLFLPSSGLMTELSDFFINDYNGVVYDEETNSYNMSAGWGAADVLETSEYAILPGAYKVTVEYDSVLNPETPSFSINDSTGHVSFFSESAEDAIIGGTISLCDGRNVSESYLWVKPGYGIKDFTGKVSYYGQGNLTIKNIEISEQISYRYVKFLGLIIGFILFDILVFAVSFPSYSLGGMNRYQIIFMYLILLFVNLPMFASYIYQNDDISYHLGRIVATADSLKSGQLFARMNQEMLNGYGYPSAIFYNPLFIYIPAILYVAAVPLFRCYQVYVIIMNCLTFVIADFSFRKITGSIKLGSLGAGLYVLSAYRLIDIYNRAAVGEYTAMVFFPLILYGLWRIYSVNDKLRVVDCFPIILGISGVLGSHVLSTIMIGEFILLFCVINLRKTFQLKRLRMLCFSVFGILILNLYWIYPFLDSYRMNLKVQNAGNTLVGSGISVLQLTNLFSFLPGASSENVMRLSMGVGVACICAIVVYLVASAKMQEITIEQQEKRVLSQAIGIGAFAMLLSLDFIPWKIIEQILGQYSSIVSNVQFAWRYLAIATPLLILGLLIGLKAIDSWNHSIQNGIMIGVLLLTIITVSQSFTQFIQTSNRWYVYSQSEGSISQNIGMGEYLLSNTSIEEISVRKVNGENSRVTSDGFNYSKGVTSVQVQNTDKQQRYVDLPIFYYDNYVVEDTSGTKYQIEMGNNNVIRVNLPAEYNGTLIIYYKEPVVWRICEIISICTFLFGGLFYIISRVRRKDKELVHA